jgi:plasmid stabilization system protein ParE
VASVIVTPTASRNLAELIEAHSLPGTTRERVRRALEPLAQFPLLGASLEGRWKGFRFILGPWRWMLVVYRYDEGLDQVAVVTIQDARSARSPTTAQQAR